MLPDFRLILAVFTFKILVNRKVSVYYYFLSTPLKQVIHKITDHLTCLTGFGSFRQLGSSHGLELIQYLTTVTEQISFHEPSDCLTCNLPYLDNTGYGEELTRIVKNLLPICNQFYTWSFSNVFIE